MKIRIASCFIPLVGVAACGGATSTAPLVVSVPEIVPMSQQELIDEGDRLQASYLTDFNNQSFTSYVSQPSSGEAQYTGVIGFGVPEVSTGEIEAQFVGQIGIGINFGAEDNQIQGTASNFYNVVDDAVLTGELMLDASIVDTTGQFEGNIAGRLTQFDPVDINMGISGGFLGGGTSVVAGSGTGQSLSLDNNEMFESGIIFAVE